MNTLKYQILFALCVTFLFLACKKENTAVEALQPESIKVFPDKNIQWSIGSVAGDGFVLLVYVDIYKQYQFKLIDNAGNEIWTKTYGYIYESKNLPSLNIIYDTDKTFAIFRANGLKKINLEGDIVFNDDDFLIAIDNASVSKVIPGNNNSYLVLGSLNNRAFVSEFSSTGKQNFMKYYFINVNNPNTFTGAVKTEEGGYLAAGTFASNTPGLESAFFLMELSANGDINQSNKTDMDSCFCKGRDFIKLDDNSYVYLVSPNDLNVKEKRSRLYRINDTAGFLGISYLDLAEQNYGAGYEPFFGNGLVKSSSGSLTGIMKSKYEISYQSNLGIIQNFKKPQYDYYYILNANGELIHQAYLNKNYSNYFNSIINMSNGRQLLFGATLSMGDEIKLITIVK